MPMNDIIPLNAKADAPDGTENTLNLMRRAYTHNAERREKEATALREEARAIVFDMPAGDARRQLEAEWHFLSSLTITNGSDNALTHMEQAAELSSAPLRLLDSTEPFYFGVQPFAMFYRTPGKLCAEREKLRRLTELYEAHTAVNTKGVMTLFDAEPYRYLGDIQRAETFCHSALYMANTYHLDFLLLHTSQTLAHVYLQKMDADGFEQALYSMNVAVGMHERNARICGQMFDLNHASIYVDLKSPSLIAPWILQGKTDQLPMSTYYSANYLCALAALQSGELSKALGIARAMLEDISLHWIGVLIPGLLHLIAMLSLLLMDQPKEASGHLESAAALLVPDGLYTLFGGFLHYIPPKHQGVLHKLWRKYPEAKQPLEDMLAQYQQQRQALAQLYERGEIRPKLTRREKEIAGMVARGMRNGEIAQALGINERTIKSHVTAIFKKLNIDRRSKLLEMLRKS